MTALGRTQQKYNHVSGSWPIAAAGLVMVLMAGCAPQASIKLVQPHVAGAQRELQLAGEQAHWAEGKQAGRVLAEFPLPGATTGRATYLLYLRLLPQTKDAKKKQSEVKFCGFFIQTRGEYAGLTTISGGSVTVRKRNRDSCKLVLDLVCEDGTRIEGQVVANRGEHLLDLFERESRHADVQKLIEKCGK